jgi:ATP-dependent RNA helicase RhlE
MARPYIGGAPNVRDFSLTQTFSELGLPAGIVSALTAAGFNTPTPIQLKAIPPQLEKRDILGIAQTGSGKTAAFGLPILAGIASLNGRPTPLTTRALILAPTRELAVQINDVLRKLASHKLSTVLVLGGTSRSAQVNAIARGVDVVIATPGRLQDLLRDRKINLIETRWLVLDEADRMLDMGFIRPVTEIAKAMSPRRQTALFSATMAPEVAELAKGLLNEPVRVEVAPPATTVTAIEQQVIMAPTANKRQTLNKLLREDATGKVLVFARTKHGADRVAKNLGIDGFEVASIHGNKSQNARQAALKGFADGRVRVLVATDIAARGIDVPNIGHVINFDLPDDPENYVHRIGRTGRNGATGTAITLCDGSERSKLRDVERLIRKTLPVVGEAAPTLPSDAKSATPRHERNAQQRAQKKNGNGNRHANARPQGGRPQNGGNARPQLQPGGPSGEGKPWWERPTGSAPKGTAGKLKPRWNKGKKDVAKTGRRPDNRPQREAVAG